MERFIDIHDRPEFRDMQLQMAITLEQNVTIKKISIDILEDSRRKVTSLRVEVNNDEGSAGTPGLVVRTFRGMDVKTGTRNAERVRIVDEGAGGTSGPKVLRTLRGQHAETGTRNAAFVRILDEGATEASRTLRGQDAETGAWNAAFVRILDDEGAAVTSGPKVLRTLKGMDLETGTRNAERVRVVDGGSAGPSRARQNNNLKMLYNEEGAVSEISITKDAPALPLLSSEYYNDLYDEEKRRHLLPNFHTELCMALNKLDDVSFATSDNISTDDSEDLRDENIYYFKEGDPEINFHYYLAQRMKFLKHERKWLSDSGYFRRDCEENSGLPEELENVQFLSDWLGALTLEPPGEEGFSYRVAWLGSKAIKSSLPDVNDENSIF